MTRHRAGRLPEAEALYRQILQAHPTHPDALHLLGLIAQQTGRARVAKDLVARAIRHRPNAPPFINSLGMICLSLDEFDQATDAFQKAIKLAPSYAEPNLNLGNLYRRRGDRAAAERCFRRAIACNPKLIEARNNLGTLLIELDRTEDAITELDTALALKPGDSQILCNLGTARASLGRDDAAECFRQVLARRPDDVKALVGLGTLFIERDHIEEAADCFERTVALEPMVTDHQLNLASTRSKQHRFDEARRLYETVAAANPKGSAAFFGLARMCVVLGEFDEAHVHFKRARDIDPLDANAIGALLDDRNYVLSAADRTRAESILDRPGIPVRSWRYLNFSLAHALERAGQYDDAFRRLDFGNVLRRKNLVRQGKAYDPAFQERRIDRIIAQFDAAFFAHARGIGDQSELPVFIVGLPRSGTTLCEQILASHPAVHGAGELSDLADMATRFDADWRGLPDASAIAGWRHEAGVHIARLQAMAPDALRVTDKAPGNFLNLGLVAALFPAARIIHCARSPLDTALSCYANNLGDHWNWTCDLESIAHYTRQYRRLMEHWHKVLPAPVLEFGYESLIGDFESRARKLVDFCGLPWAAACADFHRTKRPVYSASLEQVRQPIYASSVGKWRHYERHLEPLIGALGTGA